MTEPYVVVAESGCRNKGFQDLTGQRFSRLLVVSRAQNRGISTCWNCKCDCGNMTVYRAGGLKDQLKKGAVISCGCARRERGNTLNLKGGWSDKETYDLWRGMISRCHRPSASNYCWYGGRGIRVCERWLNSYDDFMQDMGPRPSLKHEIDRFPDKNGNYEPGNCRWVTHVPQMNNTRSNLIIEHNGKTQTLSERCKELDLNYSMILQRMRKWSYTFQEALEVPKNKKKKHFYV